MSTRTSIRFMLGDELRTLSSISPTTTVLDYLRTVEGMTGTKEGCGEGDCGACTVVLGNPHKGKMQYRSVNSCIQFLPTIDGHQLLTVENLAAADGTLHPAQQAMVECHGSQCGFCTPGFVMSLFALDKNYSSLDNQLICDSLAGNLCRCTGYGTIISAAHRMKQLKNPDRFRQCETSTAEKLTQLNQQSDFALEHENQLFFAPSTADDFASLYEKHPDATILSGGTDVGLWVTKQGRKLKTVIYTGKVKDLKKIDVKEDEIVVWTSATLSDLVSAVATLQPDFSELLRRFGSTQIRNAGTLCGNIANGSPIGDMAPALIALGGRIGLRCGSRRRELDLEDFFVSYGRQNREPGEFVEKIVFPKWKPTHKFIAYKISKRFDQDISAVCVAFNIRIESNRVIDVRIAYGGMAEIPKRAHATEQALIGEQWNEEAINIAMQKLETDFQPITDMRASSAYRMQCAKNLLFKLFLEFGKAKAPVNLIGSRGHFNGTG